MVQRNAYNSVTRCLEDSRRKHEQEKFHATCSQVFKGRTNLDGSGWQLLLKMSPLQSSGPKRHLSVKAWFCQLLIFDTGAVSPLVKSSLEVASGDFAAFVRSRRRRLRGCEEWPRSVLLFFWEWFIAGQYLAQRPVNAIDAVGDDTNEMLILDRIHGERDRG